MLRLIAFALLASHSIACVDVEQPGDDVALEAIDPELDVVECPEVTGQQPSANMQDAPASQ